MFKNIPGNHDYIISLNAEVRDKNGEVCNLPINGILITINLYGKNETVDLYWLALIAHFEIKLPTLFKSINFVNWNPLITKSNCGKVMKITKPIVINKRYRLIPNYPSYAVSKEGDVLDIENNVEVVKNLDDTYPIVYIYDPDRCHCKKVMVHRLVALAWCGNKDYFEKPIVNHIDGNKQNYHANNLEWCSYQENVLHAITNGLTTGNRQYKVRDVETGTIQNYNSFKQVCLAIGIHEDTSWSSKTNKKKTKLIKGKYEIKRFNDESPWLSDSEVSVKKNRYTIRLVFPDNSEEVFYNIVDVMRRLKIWNISYNISEIQRVAAIKHPDVKIEVTENFIEKEVQALNLKTRQVIEAKSIKSLSRMLNVGFSTIHLALNSASQYDCKGYVFRYKTDEPWETEYSRHPNAPKHIRALNVRTGEERDFSSMESVVEAFKTTHYVIKTRITNNTMLGDWEFKEILSLQ